MFLFRGPQLQRKERPAVKFPGKTCLLVVAAAAVLFHYAIFIVPPEPPAGASLPAKVASALGGLAQDHPAILGALLVGAIAPAFVLEGGARKYLLRLLLVLFLAWAGLFSVTTQPAKLAADRIRYALSFQRTFPVMFQGH